MKTITLLTLLAIMIASATNTSSVGGPMTILLIVFIAMLAVGIYEAWSQKRGPLGWIVNIVAAIVGGLVAALLNSFVMDAVISLIGFQGRIVDNPMMLFLTSASTALFTVLGAWCALQLVNRFRSTPAPPSAQLTD